MPEMIIDIAADQVETLTLHIPTIVSDPDIGETLIGDLTGIRC